MFDLSPQIGSRLHSAFPRLVMAVVLLLTLAIAASAYTLVLRNGQRVEIPAEFALTKTTLTYEVSPGFNKTMLLTLIDVAATERANNEAPGGFFQHTEEPPVDTQPAPRAIRTVTNRDLAAVRQRRIESEQAYERRRKELGLPTVEETRRRQEQEAAIFHAQLREKSLASGREETYWRGRARELRTEIATVDTQINYLRGRLSDLSESSSRTRSWVTGTYPLWTGIRRGSILTAIQRGSILTGIQRGSILTAIQQGSILTATRRGSILTDIQQDSILTDIQRGRLIILKTRPNRVS